MHLKKDPLLVLTTRPFQPSGSFRAHVLTLMTGTTIAQALPILVAPILTRVYSPEEFGVYSLYMSLVSIVSLIATARYELALILPEKEEEALNIFGLSIAILSIGSLGALIITLLFNERIANMLNRPDIRTWLYLAPATIFITGFNQILTYWLIRKRKFKRLAMNKITQSGSICVTQLIGGFANSIPGGLILGQIVGQSTGVGIIGWQSLKEEKKNFLLINRKGMKEQAKRYYKFPKYSMLADFINIVANQTPYFMLNNFFGAATVGFFALSYRILGTPIALIASSVLDVFKERASRDYVRDGNCFAIYKKTLKGLLILSFLPFSVLFFALPKVIPLVFGIQWAVAGEYAQILTVLFFVRFIVSPLSYILYIAEKQKYDLIWQICLLTATVGSLMIGVGYNSAKISIRAFSLAYSSLYLVYLFMSYNFAKGKKTLF